MLVRSHLDGPIVKIRSISKKLSMVVTSKVHKTTKLRVDRVTSMFYIELLGDYCVWRMDCIV